MEKHRLTIFVISIKSLRKQSFRTKGLIIIVAAFTFAIFCGTLLSQSICLGVNYMSGRMGADIMVVPRGCAARLQDTLLRSESNTFYLSVDIAEKITAAADGKQVSPQLYIASLNAACCTVPVQIIGFDPKTDFTIKSWMTNFNSQKLGFGEVVIGSLVNAKAGENVWLYGQPLKVVATLDDTGMGFNSAIFMTMETAHHMIDISQQSAVHPAGTKNNLFSALFIKLSNGMDITKTVNSIINTYPQTDVVVSKEMMTQVSSELNHINNFVYGIQAFLWIVSVLLLLIIFTVSTHERKREFGLYLALGATKRKLMSILMTEAFIISIIGALCGVLAGFFLMFEFSMLIATSLRIPYMKPSIGTTTGLITISLFISVITVIFSNFYSAIRLGRLEPYVMIRGNE